jgi:hypothetical protein
MQLARVVRALVFVVARTTSGVEVRVASDERASFKHGVFTCCALLADLLSRELT